MNSSNTARPATPASRLPGMQKWTGPEGFHLAVDHDCVYLYDGAKEVLMWTQDEWAEDPTLVVTILGAVALGFTYGPDALHAVLSRPTTDTVQEHADDTPAAPDHHRMGAPVSPIPASDTPTQIPPTTDYNAAAATTHYALDLIHDNGDFDAARDDDPHWPAPAERDAVLALIHLRDTLARLADGDTTPLRADLIDITHPDTRALITHLLENATWARSLPEEQHTRAHQLLRLLTP
ncbi:hypothetical protein ACH419_31255 [Streptomyces bobili]|uniref:hypothetical protein n=1 Tax=Streptomyces bobili TaxID=67280 RepID=UPI00379BDFAA